MFEKIDGMTRVCYSMAHIRCIMHKFNMSIKHPIRYHINSATLEEVAVWRRMMLNCMRGLLEHKYTILIMDKSFFLRDDNGGARLWSRVGKRIWRPYFGKHEMITVFGALELSRKGALPRQFFRTYDNAKKENLLTYLRDMHAKFGKMAVIMDGASPHRSRMIRDYADEMYTRIIFLQRGSLYLNAVKGCWNISERALLALRRYKSKAAIQIAVTNYFRTTHFALDVMQHLFRNRT